MKALAILKKKHNDKTGKSEWALVSRKSGRVLRWFGAQHPSAERVQKEERRIQYFKHHGSYEAIARVLAASKTYEKMDPAKFKYANAQGFITADGNYYQIHETHSDAMDENPGFDRPDVVSVGHDGGHNVTFPTQVWNDPKAKQHRTLRILLGALDANDFGWDKMEVGLGDYWYHATKVIKIDPHKYMKSGPPRQVAASAFTPPTKTEIVQVLQKHPLIRLKEKVKRAFLVGSFAAGKQNDESDVDILLEVEPHADQSAAQLAEAYRRPLQQYFVTHNIRGKDDSVHPQWAGRRVDLYFTYDADQEDDRPKQELASLKEGNLMVLNRTKYPTLARVVGGKFPALARVLGAPIDIENPRKDFKTSEEIAEKKIDEAKAKVKKDMEDFIKEYKQLNFYKASDDKGKEKDEYRFNEKRRKEVSGTNDLFIEEDKPKPAQPKDPKGHDEGGYTLYSKRKTLAPGIDHEELEEDKRNQRSYERNKAIWVRVGFSWEPTDDPQNPKIFWWQGTPAIIRDPAKEDYLVKRKHEYKDYSEIEQYMSKRLNTDEIIRDTSEQHIAQIRAKVAPLLEQIRGILKPLADQSLKFANYPTPIKLELKEYDDLKGEDQSFSFKVIANPNKPGYDSFNVFYVSLTTFGGKFHSPYDFKEFQLYISSDFDFKDFDTDNQDDSQKIASPDFSQLQGLVKEIQQTMKRKVPVLEVDEDEIEEEPKQLEAPAEESA